MAPGRDEKQVETGRYTDLEEREPYRVKHTLNSPDLPWKACQVLRES